MSIKDCRIIRLPAFSDGRGSLSFVESCNHIPFDIRRVYYLYNIPDDVRRGAHGHRELQQLMIAVSGSFDITVDDGFSKQTIVLNSPSEALYIPPMIWRDLENFSTDAVCLVLASELYSECDYFRKYEDFVYNAKKQRDGA